ncbi:MAG: hypothetical protein Q7S02_06050 [bacterium]|nr:hypothetical protein [bacterium]
MDTLIHEQIQELQEHRPIPHGGWKLIAQVIAVVMAMGACAAIGLASGTNPFDRNMFISLVKFGGVLIGIFGTLFAFFGGTTWTMPLAKAWWYRNAHSYVARFWFADAAEVGAHSKLDCVIVSRGEDKKDRMPRYTTTRRPHSIAISLPLNGADTRPWLAFANTVGDFVIDGRLAGWSVRLLAILDTGVVMVELRKRNDSWGVDERIVTTIGSALRYLEEIATNPNGATIAEYVHGKTAQLDAAERERDETKHELAKAVFECDPLRAEYGEAVRFVERIVHDIEASARLPQSLDGLRIVERLLDWLCVSYGEGTERSEERHAEYQAKLALVRERIAEKERREQRRHGRKTPATVSAT